MNKEYYRREMQKIDDPAYTEINVQFQAYSYNDNSKQCKTKYITLNEVSAQAIVDKLKQMYKLK